MAILKKINKPMELIPGERYLDTEKRRVLVFETHYPVSGAYCFRDVDDNEYHYYKWQDIQGKLRLFNLLDIELKALLCTSMIEFIELMIFEKDKNKGGML